MRVRLSLLLLVLFIFCLAGQGFAQETTYIKSTNTYKRLKAAIDKIGVVDTHEHFPSESRYSKKGPPDFFNIFMSSYVRSSLNTIGNTFEWDRRFLDESLSVEQRWESFKPVYERMKNTGYIQCVRIGIEKVHGIKITDAASIKKINKSIKKLYKPGVYKKVLYEMGNIDCVLNYNKFARGYKQSQYPDFFRGVRGFTKMTVFNRQRDVYQMEKKYGIFVHSVDDLEKIYRKYVDESIASGVVGFKYTGAYIRTLDLSEPSREKAEELLKRLLQLTEAEFSWAGGQAFSLEDGKALSDYCTHLMLKIIEEKGMPVSVHTGLQTFGKNDVRKSDPQLLIPLFREYKNINFDLLHGGFPYVVEFVELGKSWPNVYLNQCWFDIISPEGARRQFSEMIECVPANKIFLFGGDSHFPEQVIGQLEIARDSCAVVLTEKVLDGKFTEAEAIEFAERVLRSNSIEFFKLKIPKR